MYRISDEKIAELQTAWHKCKVITLVGLAGSFLGICAVIGAPANLTTGSTQVLIGGAAVIVGFIVSFCGAGAFVVVERELQIERAKREPGCTHVIVSDGPWGRKVTRVYGR